MRPSNEHTHTPERSTEHIRAPLAYRMAHLGIDASAIYPKLTNEAIANALNLDSTKTKRELQKFEIEGEVIWHEDTQQNLVHYPFYASTLIQEEQGWRNWYVSLPTYMNAHQISEAVGRSYGWTTATLTELYPNARRQRDSYHSLQYYRSAVRTLREITFSTPPDENWHTIGKLSELIDRDREWVLHRLAESPLKPETRRQQLTGREFLHYPPEALEVLREAVERRPQPGGSWATARTIEQLLDKSKNWVGLRLKQYVEMGEYRLDDMGVGRLHYPPEVIQALKQEVLKLDQAETAGEWANVSSLRKQLGIHGVTLARLIDRLNIEAEDRLDKKGRLTPHYSPEAQKKLAHHALELYNYPAADGWMTFSEARRYINRSAGWVHEQFSALNVATEMRIDQGGHPAEHYNPNIIEIIKQRGDALDAGEMVNILDMTRATGKSRLWVLARLEKMATRPEKRFSKGGKFIDHYPASTLEHLQQELTDSR